MSHFRQILNIISLLLLLFIQQSNAQNNYFYKGQTFGSMALFNPVNIVLDGGYGIMQLDGFSKDIIHVEYRLGSRNVWYNITNPGGPISRYGWGDFLSNEIFPINFKREYMQWLPNYELHLIGGGMTSRAIYEWYRAHHYPAPWPMMLVTIGAYHYLNEVVENGPYQGDNVDPVADLLVFDGASIVFFSIKGVNKFFSEKLNLSDWSLMPSFSIRNFSIQNQGQNFSIKWHIPFIKRWYFFRYFGLTDITGASYKLSNGSFISFGGGVRTKTLITLDEAKHRKTISIIGNVGVFYDRENSLMCSLLFGGSAEKRLNLNVYPGIIHLGKFSPGLWLIMNRQGSPTFGVITSWMPGVAIK